MCASEAVITSAHALMATIERFHVLIWGLGHEAQGSKYSGSWLQDVHL